MQPLIRSVFARPTFTSFATSTIVTAAKTHLRQLSKAHNTKAAATVCLRCQFRPPPPPPSLWTQARFLSSDTDRNPATKDAPTPSPRITPKPPPLPSPDDLENLPSRKEGRRSDLSKRISRGLDNFQTTLFTAGQKLNILTGYSDIESLKRSIEAQEQHVQESRLAVRQAKEDYQNAINRRSASQREVNELLQRKHAWSSTDLERFTQLYRSDHTNEQEEVAAQERLTQAEGAADEAQAQLARSILARYHEEQIWSDKIRRASTWGTWGLMGFNVLLFVVVQLGLEPWKRRRLVRGFEEKVREVIQEEEEKKNMQLGVQAAAMPGGLLQTPPPPSPSPQASATLAAVSEELSRDPADSVDVAAVDDTVDVAAVDDTAEVQLQPEPYAGAIVVEQRPEALVDKLGGKARRSIGYVGGRAAELLSEREVAMPQRRLTVITALSATAGATVGALLAGFIIISHR